jgi:hypothetical protein
MKRHIASCVLLAVFLPMLVFTSVHVHESHASALPECAECVAHHCHGHIGQTDVSLDDCVICQFLTLTFVAAAIAAVLLFFNALWFFHAPLPCAVYGSCRGIMVTRGPPAA